MAIEQKEFNVEGMSCMHCEMAAQKALMAVSGVVSAKADHKTGKVVVEVDGHSDEAELKQAITEAGYRVM